MALFDSNKICLGKIYEKYPQYYGLDHDCVYEKAIAEKDDDALLFLLEMIDCFPKYKNKRGKPNG